MSRILGKFGNSWISGFLLLVAVGCTQQVPVTKLFPSHEMARIEIQSLPINAYGETIHNGHQIGARFMFSKRPVTPADWDQCVQAQACPDVQGEKNGAVTVTWAQAQLFSKWMSNITGWKYRLPTAQEWYFVMRDSPAFSQEQLRKCRDCIGRVYHADYLNGFAVYPLFGQHAEWTADCYDEFQKRTPVVGADFPENGCGMRLIVNGSGPPPMQLYHAIYRRSGMYPDLEDTEVTFRLVRVE